MILREKNLLPPFSRLIAVIISANKHNLSLEGAREVKKHLNKIQEIEVMGPVDSPLLKIRKNKIKQITTEIKRQLSQIEKETNKKFY